MPDQQGKATGRKKPYGRFRVSTLNATAVRESIGRLEQER